MCHAIEGSSFESLPWNEATPTGLLVVVADASANMRHADFMKLTPSAARSCTISMQHKTVSRIPRRGICWVWDSCVTVAFGIYSNWFSTSVSLSVERVCVLVWYSIKLVGILMLHPAGFLINLLILFVQKSNVCYWTLRSSFCHSCFIYRESGFEYRSGNWPLWLEGVFHGAVGIHTMVESM